MSIQSSINATIGGIGVLKRGHDFQLAQKKNQEVTEQKIAISKQKLELRAYEAKTARKRANIQAKMLREEIKSKENK